MVPHDVENKQTIATQGRIQRTERIHMTVPFFIHHAEGSEVANVARKSVDCYSTMDGRMEKIESKL